MMRPVDAYRGGPPHTQRMILIQPATNLGTGTCRTTANTILEEDANITLGRRTARHTMPSPIDGSGRLNP